MVQEMIKKVQDAEKQASEIISEAEKNSVSSIDEANVRAVEIKQYAKKLALNEREEILAKLRHEYEEKEGTVNKQIEEEITAIINEAKANEAKAIEAVISSFY